MPTATYIALATITLTGNDSEIAFTSIPSTYRDLVLVASLELSQNGVLVSKVNGSTSLLSAVRMMGAVTLGAYSDTNNDGNIGEWYSGDNFAPFILHIMDYSATDKHKTLLARVNGLTRVMAYAQRWESTNAITSYSLTTNRAFTSGSTFTLYGIVS